MWRLAQVSATALDRPMPWVYWKKPVVWAHKTCKVSWLYTVSLHGNSVTRQTAEDVTGDGKDNFGSTIGFRYLWFLDKKKKEVGLYYSLDCTWHLDVINICGWCGELVGQSWLSSTQVNAGTHTYVCVPPMVAQKADVKPGVSNSNCTLDITVGCRKKINKKPTPSFHGITVFSGL